MDEINLKLKFSELFFPFTDRFLSIKFLKNISESAEKHHYMADRFF